MRHNRNLMLLRRQTRAIAIALGLAAAAGAGCAMVAFAMPETKAGMPPGLPKRRRGNATPERAR